MANKKSKFTLEIEALFKGDKAKQNAKNMANDISSMLDNMWNSGDAVSYFKDLVQYISMIDTAMDAFRKEHGDDFERMFAGLDTGLQQELEKLFRTTKSEMTAIDQLRKRIADTQAKIPTDGKTKLDKAEADALKKEAKAIQADVEKALGVKIKIEGNPGALKILDSLSGELDQFARNWADVTDRVSKGLGIGVGAGTGSGPAGGGQILDELDELSRELQNKIKNLDSDIDELKRKKEELLKVLRNDKEYTGNIDLNVDSIKALVEEYKQLSSVMEGADRDSEDYHNSLVKIIGVSAKLKASLNALRSAPDNVKEQFRQTPMGEDKDGNKVNLYGELAQAATQHQDRITKTYNRSERYGDLIKEREAEMQVLRLEEERIAKNKELGLSYKKLAQYAVDYMDKARKGESLTKYDKDEMTQLEKELKDFAKAKKIKQNAIKDVFKAAQSGELADEDAMLEKLCHALGVDIPRNAQKAREAIKSVERAGDGMGHGSGRGAGSGSGGEITNVDFSSLENTIRAEISSIANRLDSVLKVEIVDDKSEAIQNAVDGIKTILNGIESSLDAYKVSQKNDAEQVEIDNMKKNLTDLLGFVSDFNDNRAKFGGSAKGKYQKQETAASIFSDGSIVTNYGEKGSVSWDREIGILLSKLTRNSLMDIHSHPWGTLPDNSRFSNDAFSGSSGDLGAFRTTKELGTQIAGMITGNILRTFDVSKLTDTQMRQFKSNLAKIEQNIPNVPAWQGYAGYENGQVYFNSQNTLEGQHKVTEIFESMMYDAFQQTGISKDKVDEEIFKKYDLTNDAELTDLAERLVKLSAASQGAIDPIARLSHIIDTFGGNVTSTHAKDLFTSFRKGELTAADVFNDLTGNKYPVNQDTINALHTIDAAANASSPTLSSLSQIINVLSAINSSLRSIETSVRHDSEQRIDSTIKDVLDVAKGQDGRYLTRDIKSIFNPLNISEYQNKQISGTSREAYEDFKESLRHARYGEAGNYKGQSAAQIAQDVSSKFAKALSYIKDVQRQVDLYDSRQGQDKVSKDVRQKAQDRYNDLIDSNTIKSLLSILSNAKQELQESKVQAGLTDQNGTALSGELYKALQGVLSDVATESTLNKIAGILSGIEASLTVDRNKTDKKDNDVEQKVKSLDDLQNDRKTLDEQIRENDYLVKNQEAWIKHLEPTLNDDNYKTSGKKEATDQLRQAFQDIINVKNRKANGDYTSEYAEEKAIVAWGKAYKEAQRQKVADSTLSRYDRPGDKYSYDQNVEKLQKELDYRKNVLKTAQQEQTVLQAKSDELNRQIEAEKVRQKQVERRTYTQDQGKKKDENNQTTVDDQPKDKGDKTPDADGRVDNTSGNNYALEATLQQTNSILHSIFTAISNNEPVNDVSKALEGAINELKAAAQSIKASADELGRKIQDGSGDKPDGTSGDDKPDDTSDDKKPKTFDELKKEQLGDFDKYKQSVEGSIHLTGEFRGELDKLHTALNDVSDAEGLEAWKKDFDSFQTDLDRYTDSSKRVLTGQINAITKDAKDALKGIDLENTTVKEEDDPEGYARQLADQERIAQGFKEIQIASDLCANQIKSDQNLTAEAFNKAKQELLAQKQELLKLAHEYKTNYGFVNSGGKKGSNYGNTAIIQETSRYNQLQQYAGDQNAGFKDSSVFKHQMAEYTAAYNRLIDIRNRLAAKPVLTDKDVQEFNDAKKAAASYGKELDKMIVKSNRLASGSFKDSAIGSDIDLDDAFSRKQALTDFVTNMHDARESTIRFSNDYQECTFKMKNSDGTWTKMTATLDKFSNKMYSAAGEVTKHGTALGEFAGSLKGEFLKLGRYMIASFGIEEVIQAVRTGITYVKEIDDALTDLKKVTNETDAGYERFLQTMSKTAGVVGSTVAELTTMAAEWARLGYSMQEAANLAESTAVLLNVSEFEDATTASEALISTIQAFGYAADDSMHVVDILNEVGFCEPRLYSNI